MKRGLSYHWMIVAACFLMMATSIGIMVNTFNLLAVALVMDEAVSSINIGNVQLVLMVALLLSIVGGMIVGKLLQKYPMRTVLTVSAVLYCAGLFLYSRCNSLSTFLIVSVFVGFGAAGIGLVPCGALLNLWFIDKKGLATGIGFSGSVVGGLVFVQLTNAILASSGWRMAYMVLAAIAAIVLLPTTLLIVRAHPMEKGLQPLGAELVVGQQMKPTGISTSQYFKTSSFWLLAISVFLVGFINMAIQNNVSVYFTEVLDKDLNFATNIFSVVMSVQIFGKVLLGAIYDKKGIKFASIYCTVVYLIAAVALLRATSLVVALVFAVFFGLVSSMTTVTPPYVTARIVGVREYTSIFGLLSVFYGIGAAVGPVIAAKVFESTGSFNGALFVFMGLSLVLVLTITLAEKKGVGFNTMGKTPDLQELGTQV